MNKKDQFDQDMEQMFKVDQSTQEQKIETKVNNDCKHQNLSHKNSEKSGTNR